MNISQNLRRAFHDALDLILDALEQEGEQARPAPKRQKHERIRHVPADPQVDELTKQRVEDALRLRGYR